MKEFMSQIHTAEQFEKGCNETLSVFVFSANWCPDCRVIEPFMPELIERYSNIHFYYIDRDENVEICQSLGVMGIPSFVAFSNGNEVSRFVSRFRKTKEEIERFLSDL